MSWDRVQACFAASAAMVLLAGCQDGAPAASETMREATGVAQEIAPTDFALMGCDGAVEDTPCAIVFAGGKAVLFGAPEGAAGALAAAGVTLPDAVMVFSLRPAGTEGLARVRNTSWQNGRTRPLVVGGPRGTAGLATGLDAMFKQGDAITYIEARPRGGFDAATLAPVEVARGAPRTVFDTGDLVVTGWASGRNGVVYDIAYAGERLRLVPCEADELPLQPPARWQVTCDPQPEGLNWPLRPGLLHLIEGENTRESGEL